MMHFFRKKNTSVLQSHNIRNNESDQIFDMCDNGIEYSVYQYCDKDNNEYVQLYMKLNTCRFDKFSITDYDLGSAITGIDDGELYEHELSCRKWLTVVDIIPDDSKYHKALVKAHEYCYGNGTDKSEVHRNVVQNEDHSYKIWREKKHYKIPGRKGYVTEEEFWAWTNSIIDD